MSRNTLFDDSLPQFISFLLEKIPSITIEENVFLRDAIGKLTFVVRDDSIKSAQRAEISKEAGEVVNPYIDPDGFAVATPQELFDDTLSITDYDIPMPITINNSTIIIKLIDRRLVGGDWLRSIPLTKSIPRIIFSSLKGGVGRSTALCVAAAALATRGSRVLAIDMDVEAPGLGSMLLTKNAGTKLGLLDYLVETNLGRSVEDLLPDLIAPSWLGDGRGIVEVLPAIGTQSINNPANVLSKIARAYINTDRDKTDGISVKMQSLLGHIEKTLRYDIILIDARAGLHETTGAALLGLGAKVFLFGIDQPQTFMAYDLLLANLGILPIEDWDQRLWVVQAKASPSSDLQADFAARFRTMLDDRLMPTKQAGSSEVQNLQDIFEIEWEESDDIINSRLDDMFLEDEDRFAVSAILESAVFRDFDPVKTPKHLTRAIYNAVYGPFLGDIFQAANLSELDASDV